MFESRNEACCHLECDFYGAFKYQFFAYLTSHVVCNFFLYNHPATKESVVVVMVLLLFCCCCGGHSGMIVTIL
jgi:hypothetical protein